MAANEACRDKVRWLVKICHCGDIEEGYMWYRSVVWKQSLCRSLIGKFVQFIWFLIFGFLLRVSAVIFL